MFELKPIHKDAVPAALAKAERYRLLNEPRAAESICLDVLRIEATNQLALATLILALTDQFSRERGPDIRRAQELLPKIASVYERAYYDGVICERWGKAQLRGKGPSRIGVDWLRRAMGLFEKAESIRPAGNDDAILRWNACARLIDRHDEPDQPETDSTRAIDHGDDIPVP